MNVVSLIWNYENILDMKIYCETHFVSLQGLFFFKIHQSSYNYLAPNFFSLVLCKNNMHLSSIRCKRHPPFFVPKNAKKGKNVFLHIYVCIICCWHILLGWAITWWHYSSYVMLGNKFKPKLFFVRTSMLSSFIYYCLFVRNFANILY